jgi:hypothetical protein
MNRVGEPENISYFILADAVADSDDERNVKILVRSSVALPTMARVSAETHSHGSSAGYADGPKLNNILPPRIVCAPYQMVLGFETKKHCESAVKHVETCRLVVSFS